MKKRDVSNLLAKQFGEHWTGLQELQWFKEILDSNKGSIPRNGVEEDLLCNCECLEPELNYSKV